MKKYFFLILYHAFAKHLPRRHDFKFIGEISHLFRRAICRPLLKEAATVFGIGRQVDIGNPNNIIMKDHANLGDYAQYLGKGQLIVGKHVMMGPEVMIITQDHKILPEGFQDYVVAGIEIGDFAWIGARAIILKGVKIGKLAVIGAGAVVTKSIPDYAIAVGNPARVIKYRHIE